MLKILIYAYTELATKLEAQLELKGNGWAIMEQSIVFIAPLSIMYPFPFPPSSAGVPRMVSYQLLVKHNLDYFTQKVLLIFF